MAILFCIVFQIVILWVPGNTFSCFLGLKIFLWVLCIPNPMATLYIFLGAIYKHFCGFFGFQTPARTSFSTIPGNKCCHGNTFLLFLGLINNFMGSLHSINLHRLELISFSAIPGNNCCHGNTFLLFLGPIYKYFCGFFAFHTPTWIGTA